MLKQLKISLALEKAKRNLNALFEQRDCFESRRAAIEQRFADAGATSDAELTAIEADLSALEAEIEAADIDKNIADLEAEIKRLEAELAAIGKDAGGEAESENNSNTNNTNIGGYEMKRSTIGGNSIRARLAPLVERAEVKGWLEHLRALGGEQRAVTGAEINIPDIVLEPLREIVAEQSKLIKYVNYKTLKGRARQPIVGTVPEAVWTEMTGAINELEFGFSMVEADGYKLAGFIPVPNSILEDSDINLFAEITSMLGKAIAYGIDKAIMYGGGIKQPLGIVTRLTTATAPRDFGANAPVYTDLTSHVGYLSSESLTAEALFAELALGLGKAQSKYASGGKFWAMNENTFMTLQAKLISINAAGAIASAASMTMPIVGGDVVLLDFMPDNVIAGGYGSLYLLAEREGGAISRSEHAQFIQDNTVFKGVARYDGLPVIGEGFAMFTLSTSVGATELTFAEDKASPNDAYLTALEGTGLNLSPEFDPSVTTYTASVANNVSSTKITATARKYGKVESIKVGGTTAAGGVCNLSVGQNIITVTVKYGTSRQTYTITVTRAAA